MVFLSVSNTSAVVCNNLSSQLLINYICFPCENNENVSEHDLKRENVSKYTGKHTAEAISVSSGLKAEKHVLP